MRIFAILLLVLIVCGFVWVRFFGKWHRQSLAKARNKMYKRLEKQAADGDEGAMYHLAKLFYKEKDAQYYPLIFKWVQVLSKKTSDPAVWMMLGDLLYFGYGTDKNPEQALTSYEKALSESIVLGQDTPLSSKAHNYVEQQILRVRQELYHTN